MSLGNIYYRDKFAQRRLRHNQGDGRSLAILVLAATSIFLVVGLPEIILYANSEPDEPALEQNFSMPPFEKAGDFTIDRLPNLPDGTPATEWGGWFGDWTSLAARLGFSFVVGFSIGYLLLILLRATAVLAGLVILVLFGLQYAGVLQINWQNIEISYDSTLLRLLPRLEDFRDFVTGNLSSSGMAVVGILTGLMRR